MYNWDQIHLLHTDIARKTDLGWHMLLVWIWSSFVSLFIPAILHFTYGISLSWVFLYAMIHSIVSLLLMVFVSGNFVAKQWTKINMLIGIFGFLIHMIMLLMASENHWLIFYAPIFSGIHTAFFRVAFHVNMSSNASKEKDIWRTNAIIDSAILISSVVWPLVWWILADMYGESILFTSCIIFIVISCIPLFLTEKKHKPRKFTLHKELVFIHKNLDDVGKILLTFSSISYVQFIWWFLRSIILFSFFGNYTKVWLLSTITSIFVVWLVMYLWKRSDNDTLFADKRVKRSVWLLWTNRLLAWLIVAFWVFTNVMFLVVDTVHKLTYRVNNTYLTKLFYQQNDLIASKNPLLWVIIRELAIHAAKIVMCWVFAILFWIIGDSVSYISIPLILTIVIVPLQLVLISSFKKSSN